MWSVSSISKYIKILKKNNTNTLGRRYIHINKTDFGRKGWRNSLISKLKPMCVINKVTCSFTSQNDKAQKE